MTSIKSCLSSDDPLSIEIINLLIEHKEEDFHLDYKQDFNSDSDGSWLELTKDISAFANTEGGYLVFGVSDKKKVLGLTVEISEVIGDVNKIHQKINRNIDPKIHSLRSKVFEIEGVIVVALFIPQSKGKTHLISKDGTFKYPSGDSKPVLRQGTFYVRRSGGNHLGDSMDFNDVIDRRIEQFREALVDKVARVISAPENSQIYFSTTNDASASSKSVVVDGSTDAVSIEGMSFTVPPKGNVEEIYSWTALHESDKNAVPPVLVVWNWYSQRSKIDIAPKYKLMLFKFSLWSNVPSLYWVQDLKSTQIKPALLEAIRGRPVTVDSRPFLMAAAFLGENFFDTAVESFGPFKQILIKSQKTFPANGPRKHFLTFMKKPNQTDTQLRVEKLKTLNSIADSTVTNNKLPSALNTMDAIKIDCLVYAKDEYK